MRDFSRTQEALRIYDEQEPILFNKVMATRIPGESGRLMDEIDKLAEAVGIAFGEDTKDINNPETCRQCIRPGPAVPPPGAELSFVRKTIKKFAEGK